MYRIGIACYPTIGGSGIVASLLGHDLALRGHRVHFFSYDVPVRLLQCECECIFHHVEVPSYPVMRFPPYTMALASKLFQTAVDEGLDVLHMHYAIPHSTSGILARQMLKKRTGKDVAVVTTLHGTDTYLVGLEPSYRSIVEYCLDESDAVTAVSQHLKTETLQNFQLECQIEVIYNFLTECKNKIQNKEEEPYVRKHNEKQMIQVSNFRSLKRVSDALRIFELVTRACPCHLVMVGDGPEIGAAEKLSSELGIRDRVTFTGPVSDAGRLIASSDILLSTSEIESFGLTIAEAMARSVPVVATRVGGVPEVVQAGKTGYLCELGDLCGMACAALRILTNEKLAEDMGTAGKARVEQHFSSETIVPQYEALYERVLGSR